MSYYSVLEVMPTGEDRIADNIGAANAPVARHGGKYLVGTAARSAVTSSSKARTTSPEQPCKRPFC